MGSAGGTTGDGRVDPGSQPSARPIGKWAVDHGDGDCTLARKYAARTLALSPNAVGDTISVVVTTVADRAPTGTGRESWAIDDRKPVAATVISTSSDGSANRLTSMTPNSDAQVATLLRTASTLTIATPYGHDVFALRGIAPALTALDACEDDPLACWGINPAAYRSQRRPVTPVRGQNPGEWFGPDAYPRAAFGAHASGHVIAVLDVNAAGKTERCRIVQSAGTKALDHATCAIASFRARFLPALDRDGAPAASWFILPAPWAYPDPL